MKHLTFYTGLAVLFTHELDAVANREWGVLPLMNRLPEDQGFTLFLFLHIPLFATLVALAANTNEKIRIWSRTGISIFLVIHGGLHALFMGDPNYEFTSFSSNILIFGGAVTGMAHLLLAYSEKPPQTP